MKRQRAYPQCVLERAEASLNATFLASNDTDAALAAYDAVLEQWALEYEWAA